MQRTQRRAEIVLGERTLDNKPTNGEFIAFVAGKLSMDPRIAS